MQTTETTTSALKYSITKIVGKESITVNIRLNDECKNGHEDFSITGEVYQAGKPKTDKNLICCGCIHEEILKHFPEFKIFVNVHLADYSGIPLYAIANGYYHLKHGFNSASTSHPEFKREFCEYYRIKPDQFEVLKGAYSQAHYGMLLTELNIFDQWKAEAKEAIKILEDLTGQRFESATKGTQLDRQYRDGKAFQEEAERIASGYYSDKAVKERTAKKVADQRQEIIDYADKQTFKIKRELDIKLALFDIGGQELVKNVIYYDHIDTIKFNWSIYGNERRYTQEEAQAIFDKINDGNLQPHLSAFKVEK